MRILFLSLASVICFSIATAFAQVSGGAFRGEVRDSSGAMVPGTKITIRSNDTGVEIQTVSNSEGQYATATLIPGSYTLTAIKEGFKNEVFGPVTLLVNQTMRVDFVLNVGATSETIKIEASGAQLLATESSEISQVIVSK